MGEIFFKNVWPAHKNFYGGRTLVVCFMLGFGLAAGPWTVEDACVVKQEGTIQSQNQTWSNVPNCVLQ